MNDYEHIDWDSPALQYRIVDAGGAWRLERANPGHAMTTDEHTVLADLRQVVGVDAHGRLVVPDPARDEMDAEVGDVISLQTFAEAWASAAVSVFKTHLTPVLVELESTVEEMADGIASAVGETPADGARTVSEHADLSEAEQRVLYGHLLEDEDE